MLTPLVALMILAFTFWSLFRMLSMLFAIRVRKEVLWPPSAASMSRMYWKPK